MKEKKISVIIPCYNVSEFIDRCVKSLVDQTIGIEELECIFVDDASTDDTLERLLSWEEKFPESILVVPCQENHKQGAARNVGLSYATGQYIAFLDSDDYVDVGMYEAMYQKAVDLQCDVVGSFFARETRDGRQLYRDETRLDTETLVMVDTLAKRKELLVNGLPSGVNTRLYRRNLIIDNQLWFPEDIQYEDNYWGAILLGLVSSYYIIDSCFYHYVVNEASTVMEQNAEHHLDRLVIEVMKVEKYKEDGMFQEYHDEIEFNFLRLFFINTIRILFVRFDQIPYQIIYDMQGWVLELFPNYQGNPYLEKLSPLQLELLKIIPVDLTPDKIEILAQGYRSVLKK